MKKSYWITGLVLIVVIVAGILIWNNQQPVPNNQIVQECSNQNGYCVYNNIPSSLQYTSPNEEVPENFMANSQEVLSQYFKRTASEGKTIDEAFGLDPEKWVCKNGDKILEVKYFYDLCEGMEGMAGCGYERKAFVCDDVYFIEQYADWSGPVMYGPFSIEN